MGLSNYIHTITGAALKEARNEKGVLESLMARAASQGSSVEDLYPSIANKAKEAHESFYRTVGYTAAGAVGTAGAAALGAKAYLDAKKRKAEEEYNQVFNKYLNKSAELLEQFSAVELEKAAGLYMDAAKSIGRDLLSSAKGFGKTVSKTYDTAFKAPTDLFRSKVEGSTLARRLSDHEREYLIGAMREGKSIQALNSILHSSPDRRRLIPEVTTVRVPLKNENYAQFSQEAKAAKGAYAKERGERAEALLKLRAQRKEMTRQLYGVDHSTNPGHTNKIINSIMRDAHKDLHAQEAGASVERAKARLKLGVGTAGALTAAYQANKMLRGNNASYDANYTNY